MGGKRIIFPPD